MAKKMGFALMTPEKLKETGSKGGKVAHQTGMAHEFTKEEAKAAGSKGGLKVAQDKEWMRKIAKMGSDKRTANLKAKKERNQLELFASQSENPGNSSGLLTSETPAEVS